MIRSTRSDELESDSEKSMKSLIFPDVNLWIALNYEKHSHNNSAIGWYESLDPSTVFVFCRHTQLGLFRLLSTESVMKQDVMDEPQRWDVCDRWNSSGFGAFRSHYQRMG